MVVNFNWCNLFYFRYRFNFFLTKSLISELMPSLTSNCILLALSPHSFSFFFSVIVWCTFQRNNLFYFFFFFFIPLRFFSIAAFFSCTSSWFINLLWKFLLQILMDKIHWNYRIDVTFLACKKKFLMIFSWDKTFAS